MKSVLFVCLGNICRSPLGEGILRYKANERGLDIKIESAGTNRYHVGDNPDSRSILVARSKGINISRQVARQFRSSDFDDFDLILVADAEVYRDLKSWVRGEDDMKKVDFMMNMLEPGSNKPVPDPYYGRQEGFEKVYDLLDKVCDSLIAKCE